MLKHACKTGLERVVSKVSTSKYASGRSNDWVKVTCAQRETLPIAGFALDGNKWSGLYIGRRQGAELIYAGKVDHGFDAESEKELRARLKPLIRRTQPYTKRIAHRGIWVEPAEIEYQAKSAQGKVRHPFFKGLREDLCFDRGNARSNDLRAFASMTGAMIARTRAGIRTGSARVALAAVSAQVRTRCVAHGHAALTLSGTTMVANRGTLRSERRSDVTAAHAASTTVPTCESGRS
jgi:ATP dependent DNA ligase-like protein